MQNPINWGGTPLENAAARGAIAGFLTGLITFLLKLQGGAEVQAAAIDGAIPAALFFLGMLGYGAADNARASSGQVIASDVPVQIESKILPGPITMGAAADAPRTTRLSPQEVARNSTANFQRLMRGQRGR